MSNTRRSVRCDKPAHVLAVVFGTLALQRGDALAIEKQVVPNRVRHSGSGFQRINTLKINWRG